MKPLARISLRVDDAEHVYEWLRMFWLGEAQKFGGCAWCERIGRRLERLIGPARVRRTARVVKKNPGRRTGTTLSPEVVTARKRQTRRRLRRVS